MKVAINFYGNYIFYLVEIIFSREIINKILG